MAKREFRQVCQERGKEEARKFAMTWADPYGDDWDSGLWEDYSVVFFQEFGEPL